MVADDIVKRLPGGRHLDVLKLNVQTTARNSDHDRLAVDDVNSLTRCSQLLGVYTAGEGDQKEGRNDQPILNSVFHKSSDGTNVSRGCNRAGGDKVSMERCQEARRFYHGAIRSFPEQLVSAVFQHPASS